MFEEGSSMDALLSRVVDGAASEEELRALEALLRTNPEARRRYVHAMDLHAELQARGALQKDPESVPEREREAGRALGWFRWGSRAALAAGIVIGVFGTSLVFGAVVAGKKRGIPLLRDGFEKGPAPKVTGLPRECGVWSGDFCDIADAQGDVRPAHGKKMLRFLRADYEGKPNPEGNRTSGIWYLADVRGFGREILGGDTEVQISTLINGAPSERTYMAFLSVYAWRADAWERVNRQDWRAVDSSALALSRGSKVDLDQDAGTWQRLDAALRLPPQTEFVLIQAAIKQTSHPGGPVAFGEQFLDHVRMTMWTRAPMQ
ncbi:MAG: hypothetical protein RLZZ399_551 [Verrucomicrobiota bacterium]|jgi:hypothetical protein